MIQCIVIHCDTASKAFYVFFSKHSVTLMFVFELTFESYQSFKFIIHESASSCDFSQKLVHTTYIKYMYIFIYVLLFCFFGGQSYIVGGSWLPWGPSHNSAEFLFYVARLEHHKIKSFHHHSAGMETEVFCRVIENRTKTVSMAR